MLIYFLYLLVTILTEVFNFRVFIVVLSFKGLNYLFEKDCRNNREFSITEDYL